MTLEKSKGYAGAAGTRPAALQQVDAPELRFTPHQAPQRERVSRSAAPKRVWKKKERNWKAHLRDDVNLGVPQLMMLLEPNIVWDHHTAIVGSLDRDVEAQYCPNNFLHGFNRRGRTAYGVYEGSYWDLLGDLQELTDILKRMAIAPPLLEDPVLAIPPEPQLPAWDDFKPSLISIPSAPAAPTLKLPPFKSPILATELPFIEPKLLPVPNAPDPVQEEAHPEFQAPVFQQIPAFEAPEFQRPAPPAALDQPRAPVFGAPKHGLDWSGTRPFHVPEPLYQQPELHAVPEWQNPPAYLPPPPAVMDVKLEAAQLDLAAVPKMQLAWVSGPEPEPAYCSLPTSPLPSPSRSCVSSHAHTGRPSRPPSAGPSRPPSTGPSRPASASTSHPPSASPSRPASASTRPPTSAPPSRPSSATAHSRPQSARSSAPGLHPAPRSRPPSAKPVRAPTPEPLAPTTPGREQPRPSLEEGDDADEEALVQEDDGEAFGEGGAKTELQRKWDDVRDAAAGKPAVWLDFDAPFAELPPLFVPPEPKKAESAPFVPPSNLMPLPEFVQPVELAEPAFHAPAFVAPTWADPREPRPIGFLRGAGPVLIMDVSGTMHPARGGRFLDVKACVAELLGVDGEVGAAANAFDVVAFASNAWSWSAVYEGKMKMLQTSQVFHSGRQAGGKVGRPQSAAAGAVQVMLQPCQPDTLEDAQNWVRRWPEAVGHTSFMAALQLAAHHLYADCWYLFSDGQADDAQKTLDWLQARLAGGVPTPPIHTVGFFLDDSMEGSFGERLLRQISSMTGGTYQAFNPAVTRLYNPGVGGFEIYDGSRDPATVVREREWVEAKLRAERRRNLKLGISERLAVTIARVQAIHKAERVSAMERGHMDHMERMQQQHWQAVAAIKQQNAASRMAARQQWEAACESTRHFNEAVMMDAQHRHQQLLQRIDDDFEAAHAAWREHAAKLLQHRQQFPEAAGGGREGQAGMQGSSATVGPAAGPAAALGVASSILPAVANGPLQLLQQQGPNGAQGLDREQSGRGAAGPASSSAEWAASAGMQGSGTARQRESDDESVYSDWSDPDTQATQQQQQQQQQTASYSRRQTGEPVAIPTTYRRPSGEGTPPGQATAAVATPVGDDQEPEQGRPAGGASCSSRPTSATGSGTASGTRSRHDMFDAGSLCVAPEYATGACAGGRPAALQQQVSSDTQQLLQMVGAQLADGMLRVDAEDMKRTVLPAEVVEGVDSLNRQHLEDLRSEWGAVVSATNKRNDDSAQQRVRAHRALEDYGRKVVQIFASTFATSVVKAAANEAANQQLLRLAKEAHQAAVEKADKENRAAAELHQHELVERKRAEDAHTKATLHWEAAKVQLSKEHEQRVKEALEAHKEEVQRLQRLWEVQKQQLEAEQRGVLAAAQEAHAVAVAAVDNRNLAKHTTYQAAMKARKVVERENAAVLAEARAQHKMRLGSLEKGNEALLAEAQQQHQTYCQQLQEEHTQLQAALQAEHAAMVAAAQQSNVEMLAAARAQLQAAVARAKAAHEAACTAAGGAYEAALREVQARNAEIWPQVQVARVAQAELQRVARFHEHIHLCAHKAALGVNFRPNTPNFSRVVEMSALTEALHKAFPDVAPADYPWPEHERRGEAGAGWTPAPEAKPIKHLPTGAAALKALLRPLSAQARLGGGVVAGCGEREEQWGDGEEAGRRGALPRPQTAPSQHRRPTSAAPRGASSLLSAASPSRVTFAQRCLPTLPLLSQVLPGPLHHDPHKQQPHPPTISRYPTLPPEPPQGPAPGRPRQPPPTLQPSHRCDHRPDRKPNQCRPAAQRHHSQRRPGNGCGEHQHATAGPQASCQAPQRECAAGGCGWWRS